MVRKAPSEFNESRFISMTIYNEFLLSIFLNVSMFFLQKPANPDLLYIIFFCHSQLTITILLCLIFASKLYLVMKGQGKEDDPGGNHQAGGGNVRIHNEKLEFKVGCDWWTAGHVSTILTSDWLQVQSRIGSLANVKHRPGGGDKKIFDDKEYTRQMVELGGGMTRSGSSSLTGSSWDTLDR